MALTQDLEYTLDEDWIFILAIRDMDKKVPSGPMPDGTQVVFTAEDKEGAFAIGAELENGIEILDADKWVIMVDVTPARQSVAPLVLNDCIRRYPYQLWVGTPTWSSVQLDGELVIKRSLGRKFNRLPS
jgi:hypothetical protein